MNQLLAAIEAQSLAACKGALEIGEDPNVQDARGQTPLHYCGRHKALDCAALLLNHGARVDTVDEHGNQPLWTAVFEARGDYSIVEILVRYGANPNHLNKHGRSPLMFAEQIGDRRLVEILKAASR